MSYLFENKYLFENIYIYRFQKYFKYLNINILNL